MSLLPQHDPSLTRSDELAAIRDRYSWDHDYLPPIPLLAVPGIENTGLLNIADIVSGFYLGLPVEEQASPQWLLQKALAAMPSLLEFMGRVSASEYLTLMGNLKVVLKRNSQGWVGITDDALKEVLKERADDRSFLPRIEELGDILSTGLVAISNDTTLAIDDGKSLLSIAVDVAEWVLCTAAREATGPSAEESIASLASSGASTEVQQLAGVLQSLFRFSSKTRDYSSRIDPENPLHILNFSSLEMPSGPDPTRCDATFGWHHLAGPNPAVLQRVQRLDQIPECFPVTDQHLQAALLALGLPLEEARQQSLEGAIAAGRLYLTDYQILDGLPCQDGIDITFFGQHLTDQPPHQRYLPAPIGLLYRWGDDRTGGLRPVALQLGQDPNQYEIFTPAEEADLWQRVKMLYLSADLNHHEMVTHLSGVHFLLEAVSITTARQLHPDHPISTLLRPHFSNLIWNNFLGRQILVNPEGFIEQIMPGKFKEGSVEIMLRAYREWDLSRLDFPAELDRRGVDDVALLPNYPFRDDGLRIWNAIHRFVSGYVGVYYPSAEELAADPELGSWVAELAAPQGAHMAGMPSEITDPETLARLLTNLIFHSGPHHSAVNFPQYPVWGNPYQIPSAIYADPRKVREHTREDYFHRGEIALVQAAVMYILSSMKGDMLTDYQMSWFSEPSVWPLVAEFRVELDNIETQITRDNATHRAGYPYNYLRPSQISLAANV